jgi:hypothetical protein
MVPCDPLAFLNADYGLNKWKMPLKRGYKWANFEFRGQISDAEWPHSIKFYTKTGFDKESTMSYIEEYATPNTTIPDIRGDEDEF